MTLTIIDWLIIAGYFALTLLIGFWFRSRASKNVEEFFVSGRSLPWWIAGTSMVATTFAADTPLAVTGLIVKNGLAGNWFWWAFAMGGMFTVFVYARMWRRSEVLTDVELVRIRYGGRPGAWLRYIRAAYVALIVNPIIIGWVIGAMLTVMEQTVFHDASPEGGLLSSRLGLAWVSVIGMMVVVGIYSTLSGMWGVAISDVIQFCLAMAGCVWLAIIAVNHVGGVDALRSEVAANYGDAQALNFLPSFQFDSANPPPVEVQPQSTDEVEATLQAANRFLENEAISIPLRQGIEAQVNRLEELRQFKPGGTEESGTPDPSLQANAEQLNKTLAKATPGPWMALHVFLIMLTMQWWATWYPGAEPGGGGYVVQRMASCRDERHSMLATLWYQVAHYCVRPWPWIMISFVALAMYPELRANYLLDESYDPGVGFPMVMRDLCSPGLAGLMLVAFMAAFMSTISTQINWGASYLVRDFIQPLMLDSKVSDQQLSSISRWVSVGLLILGIAFGYGMQDIDVDDAWKLLAALGAGTGLVFMLRWFWWRINAWSEIVAMVSSLIYYLILNFTPVSKMLIGDRGLLPEEQMALIAVATILTWLLFTWLTPPEDETLLRQFFRQIAPGGPGWKPIAQLEPGVKQDPHLAISIVGALLAAGIVYLTLPGIGQLIFGQWQSASLLLLGAAVCGWGVRLVIRRIMEPESGSLD